MNELKLCPFCGEQPKLELTITNVSIKCVECDARIIKIITVRDQPDVDYFKSLAIEEWNKRANEWISVKDRLPELNIEVLCFNGSKRFGAYTLAELVTDSLGEMGWHVFGLHEYDAGFGCVTHWMPLPEPPKDE